VTHPIRHWLPRHDVLKVPFKGLALELVTQRSTLTDIANIHLSMGEKGGKSTK
jgi:hypothetical protein